MIRGTTPTNIFNVDADMRTASAIYITYDQDGTTIFEKELEDITVEEKKLTVTLTQEETLKLKPMKTRIQIRAKFPDDSAIASNIIETTASAILKDGVI